MEQGGLWLSPAESDALVAAIQRAEKDNRGEVRVHFEKRCKGDALHRARALFGELGMAETARDTGVLLYVSPGSRKAAVFAGQGVHRTTDTRLWDDVIALVSNAFAGGEGAAGIVAAVDKIGDILRERVSGEDGAGNELPDAVTTS